MSTGTITCGNCHKKHSTADEVRACYRGEQIKVTDGKRETVRGGLPAFATDPATEMQLVFARDLLEAKDISNVDKLFDGFILETMMNVMEEGKAVSKREVSDLITALKQCPYKERKGERKPPAKVLDTIPEGRYATVGVTAAGAVDFWEVDKPQNGKWRNRTFINGIVGAPGDWRRLRSPRVTTNAAAEAIGKDIQGAARLFGYKTRTCGRCGSPLSKDQSRAAGYGRHCAELLHWPYPTKDEAKRILNEMGEALTDLKDGSQNG
jgi:hypothetical protein